MFLRLLPPVVHRITLSFKCFSQNEFITISSYGLISVRESQEGNIRVFEGVNVPSPREPYVVKTEDPHGCCTLCSLGLDVKHTVSSMY